MLDLKMLKAKATPKVQEPTVQELMAEIARLKAEQLELTQRPSKPLSMRVSEKGAVSVYGLGRYPVTLYGQQWIKLCDKHEAIIQFIADNASKLTVKD